MEKKEIKKEIILNLNLFIVSMINKKGEHIVLRICEDDEDAWNLAVATYKRRKDSNPTVMISRQNCDGSLQTIVTMDPTMERIEPKTYYIIQDKHDNLLGVVENEPEIGAVLRNLKMTSAPIIKVNGSYVEKVGNYVTYTYQSMYKIKPHINVFVLYVKDKKGMFQVHSVTSGAFTMKYLMNKLLKRGVNFEDMVVYEQHRDFGIVKSTKFLFG